MCHSSITTKNTFLVEDNLTWDCTLIDNCSKSRERVLKSYIGTILLITQKKKSLIKYKCWLNRPFFFSFFPFPFQVDYTFLFINFTLSPPPPPSLDFPLHTMRVLSLFALAAAVASSASASKQTLDTYTVSCQTTYVVQNGDTVRNIHLLCE